VDKESVGVSGRASFLVHHFILLQKAQSKTDVAARIGYEVERILLYRWAEYGEVIRKSG